MPRSTWWALGIAIAFCLLAFLYVRHEWTYDAFHENADRIYRVYTENDRGRRSASAPAALGPALAEALPDVRIVRIDFDWKYRFIQHRGTKIAETIYVADPDIFEVFSFPLLKGDPATALLDPQSVVITENMAEKYFPGEDPMGKTLTIKTGNGANTGSRDLTVTGNSWSRFPRIRVFASDSFPGLKLRAMNPYGGDADYLEPTYCCQTTLAPPK